MNRRTRGASLLEMVMSIAFVLMIIAAAGSVAKTSGDLAAASGMADGASRRVQRVLEAMESEIRRSSLASFRRVDGTAFADGGTDSGIQFRRVLGYAGASQLDDVMSVRWVRASGAAEGDVVRFDGPLQETLARDVSDFAVTRAGNAITIRVAVQLGPQNDRGRIARGSVTVFTRNP